MSEINFRSECLEKEAVMLLGTAFERHPVKMCEKYLKTIPLGKKTQPVKKSSSKKMPTKKPQVSKKTQQKRMMKKCMFRIRGTVVFKGEDKFVTPDITCSKIVNGKRRINYGNVICDTCNKYFCCPIVKDGVQKYGMKRNCFEKHKKEEGGKCKDAKFIRMSQFIPS